MVSLRRFSNVFTFSSLLVAVTGCYDQVATQTGFGVLNEAPPCTSVPYSSLGLKSNLLVINTGNSSFGELQILQFTRTKEVIDDVKHVYGIHQPSGYHSWYFNDFKKLLNPEIPEYADSKIVFCAEKVKGNTLAFIRSTGGGLWQDGWGAITISKGGFFSDPGTVRVNLGFAKNGIRKAGERLPGLQVQGLYDSNIRPSRGAITYTDATSALNLVKDELNFEREEKYTKEALFVSSCKEFKTKAKSIRADEWIDKIKCSDR
jgi:hypothetical protein